MPKSLARRLVESPHGKKLRETATVHRKKIAYVLVGGWNTVFGYGSYAALYFLGKRLGFGYMVALGISQFFGILNAFIGYKHLVFRSKGRWFPELIRFSTVYWIIFAANVVALPAMVHGLNWGPLLAQAVFTCVTVVITYFAHDWFSFKTAQLAS